MTLLKRYGWLMVLMVLLSALLLTGCQSDKPAGIEEISTQLNEVVLEDSETVSLSDDQLLNYFSFGTDVLSDYRVSLRESESGFQMVAVFAPKNQDNRKTVLEGINKAIAVTASTYKALNQGEYQKIQNRLLYEKDDLLILVVSDQYDKARSVLEQYKCRSMAPTNS